MARKTKAQQQAEQNKLIVRVITIVILFAFAILGFTKAGIVGDSDGNYCSTNQYHQKKTE